MSTDIYSELHDEGVFQYGSDELIKYEQQLTKYFSREYKRHRGNENQSVDLGHGPLALVPEKLADDHYDEGITFFESRNGTTSKN